MFSSSSRRFTTALAITTVAAIGVGCNESVTDVSRAAQPQAAVTVPTATQKHADICVSGPAGTYTFSVSETDPSNVITLTVTDPFSQQGDTCQSLANSTAGGGSFGTNGDVTVTLVSAPAGVSLDDITKIQYRFASTSSVAPEDTVITTLAGPSGTLTIGLELAGVLIFNFSQDEIPGDEGCTPGYWKQTQHFDSWVTYLPTQTIGSVFTGSAYSSTTLLAALSLPGGSGVAGAERILLRAAVAALLNSTGVNYTMTTAEVISAVNAALASGNRQTMLDLAGELDADNNLGCPLN